MSKGQEKGAANRARTDTNLAAFAQLSSESPSLNAFMAERGITALAGELPEYPAIDPPVLATSDKSETARSENRTPDEDRPVAEPAAQTTGQRDRPPAANLAHQRRTERWYGIPGDNPNRPSRSDGVTARTDYKLQFLQRIEGFGKPNRNMNLTDRSHNLIALLTKYAQPATCA